MPPDENGDKKHEATPRRLEEAREKGQVPKSQDMASAIVLLFAVVLLLTLGQQIAHNLFMFGQTMLQEPLLFVPENQENDALEQSALALFQETILRFWRPLSVFFVILLIAAIVANLGQIGFLWLPEKIKIDFTHLDPVKGLKRMFSMQSVVRLLMGLLKIAICATVAWYAVRASIGEILHLSENDTTQIVSFLIWTLLMVALKVAIALVIISILDLIYQRWKHMRDLRMTDQELRDEIKNMLGDPQIISKRRQIQQEMAKKQRVQGTEDADVVVTNPTHYAVAIKFDARTMDGPVIVAKGTDLLAFQIRKIAAENSIPVVERKELARSLFDTVEIGEPVTLVREHMQTLTEVLIYAYNLAGRDFLGEYDQRQRNRNRSRRTG